MEFLEMYKGDSINVYIFSHFIHFDELLLQLCIIDFLSHTHHTHL